MIECQYNYFRDLDRRCVAQQLEAGLCREMVKRKRQAIEAPLNRANPVAQAVLAGQTTFVAVYDGFSREFRGLRRFVPKAHDPAWNERLDHLARIVPNVRHFRRRSLVALDNPLNTTLYGALAGFGLGAIWGSVDGVGVEPGAALEFLASSAALALVGAAAGVGFIFGTVAMLKYRTRDYHMIHAREAAGYMDANYALCRAGDDEAWAAMLRQAGGSGTRPD